MASVSDLSRGPAVRMVYRREWRKVAALERRIANECDLASFVSHVEAALFARLDARLRGHGSAASSAASIIAISIRRG